ncbi:hypothetical protein HDF14_001039 [Edaphobacter lichenicola]|uniref:Transmembrane protein n=1 Tax=Tunturiibacter gelidiferens TaxID=3069689 RepID=A0A9X0QBQ9_9BACT|nr:hypothetical protein [Edaphobacter lichenicola]
MDLLVFLRGVWGNWCFGCGVLVVSLWWIDGANVVIRRVFFWGENYANFFGFILGLLHPFAREQQRVKYLGLSLWVVSSRRSAVRSLRECPYLKIEIWGTRHSAFAYFVAWVLEGAG